MTTSKKKSEYISSDRRKCISDALSYIELHLSEGINPESIADSHFISRSQLYRGFYDCTGHSIKEYIRKRRVSNACEKIKSSDIPLSIIAEESGCETQQAFNKQFKSIVGITPLEYRQGDTYFYFYPFSTRDISFAVNVGTENIPQCRATRFYDSTLNGIEDKAIASLGEITGRVFGRNGKQIGNQFCYEVMTEQNGSAKTVFCATCTVNYNESEINSGWNYLYNIWLANSMFEETGDIYFEEYIFRNGKMSKLKLYLPVKKRKTEHHFKITFMPETVFVIARERGHDAEHKASERVMKLLQQHNPILIREAKRFYVCAYDDVYECGMEYNVEYNAEYNAEYGMNIPGGNGLEIKRLPAGRYAVLPHDRLGDTQIGAVKMDLWLHNNDIRNENEPVFVVYETLNGRYDNRNISMKIYKRLKI